MEKMLSNLPVGVDIFFVISGFIIYTITTNPMETQIKSFLTKRFFRIYPLFVILWLVSYFIIFDQVSVNTAFRSLLFFHVDYTLSAPAFKFNLFGPAWTLTYEIYFYLIFLISSKVSHKYRGYLCTGILLLLPLILQLMFNEHFSILARSSIRSDSNNVYESPLCILSSTIFWDFATGIVIAMAYQKINQKSLNEKKSILTIFSLFFLIGFFDLVFLRPASYLGFTGLLTPAILFIFSVLIITEINQIQFKALLFLGEISYSLYLTHWVILKSLPILTGISWMSIPAPFNLILFIFITILISYVSYKYIEVNSISLARRILRNKSKINDATSLGNIPQA